MSGLGEIEERLAACWRACAPDEPAALPIDTRRVLRSLGDASGLGPEEAESVHALCRKIHVAGRVASGYAAGWKRDPASAPIPPGLWPVVVLVLLRLSALAGDPGDERRTGLSWKLLNAVFAALDLAKREGVDVGELERLAGDRLAEAAR